MKRLLFILPVFLFAGCTTLEDKAIYKWYAICGNWNFLREYGCAEMWNCWQYSCCTKHDYKIKCYEFTKIETWIIK